MGPKEGLRRLGLVAGIAGSVLVLSACTRPGGSSVPATPSIVIRSVTPARTTTPATRTTAAPISAAPSAAPPSVAPAPSAAPPSAAPAPSAKPATGQKYVVQAGDTLGSIAAQFGVPIQDIITANRIENPDLVIVGQELIIPGR